MFSRLFSRIRRDDDIATALYGAIVAQARSPALYAEIGVPDSVSGRFEMVVLHVVILLQRLEVGSEAARAAGQGVFDHFCRDMDNSLRQMGIGDLSVPRHMRNVGEAYFGRAQAYQPNLADGQAEFLADTLKRTVFPAGDNTKSANALAAYALEAVSRVNEQDESDIIGNGPNFPDVTASDLEETGK